MKNLNIRRVTKLKTLIKLKINVLVNLKILKFKKQKWVNFVKFFKNESINSKFKKYKIIDQYVLLIDKKNLLELNYKNKFCKKLFIFSKIFNLFFGSFSKKYIYILKNKIKKSFKLVKKFIFQLLDSRLDLILYKSKLVTTVKAARQLIFHGHVFVNGFIIKTSSFFLKSGDLIKLPLVFIEKLQLNLVMSSTWPLIPNYLIINYKIFQILFLSNFIKIANYFFYTFFFLRLHKFFINI